MRSIVTRTPVVWFCLLLVCNPAAGSEADQNAAPVDKAATGSVPDSEQADEKHEDILDRVFSPLDDAVTDINRDINKGDAGATSGPSD